MKITANHLQIAGANYFSYRQNLIVPNVSWGMELSYEADLVVVTNARYAYEIEIKISLSDLKADKKKRKHLFHGDKFHSSNIFKLYYFLIPNTLFEGRELEIMTSIPENAGLLVASKYDDRWRASVKRTPTVNKAAKKLTDKEYLLLAKLGCMRIWSLKEKLLRLID